MIDLTRPVLWSAFVDGGPDEWTVTVTGLPPYDQTRIYQIAAKSDNEAAFEGGRRFEDEARQSR